MWSPSQNIVKLKYNLINHLLLYFYFQTIFFYSRTLVGQGLSRTHKLVIGRTKFRIRIKGHFSLQILIWSCTFFCDILVNKCSRVYSCLSLFATFTFGFATGNIIFGKTFRECQTRTESSSRSIIEWSWIRRNGRCRADIRIWTQLDLELMDKFGEHIYQFCDVPASVW